MESSRRDLSNDMAEHTPILENNQNTLHLCFGYFQPKTGIAFPKTKIMVLLWSLRTLMQLTPLNANNPLKVIKPKFFNNRLLIFND